MLVHAYRALAAVPTPHTRSHHAWGEASIVHELGSSRRVGSVRRRAAIAEALRVVAV